MLDELEKEMRRVTDDILMQMFRMSGSAGEVWSPRVDVYETRDAIVLKVCVAGLDPSNIELTLSGDNKFLTIRGIRAEQDDDKAQRVKYHQLEVYYGPFERTVAIPQEVTVDRDDLSAVYKDGFLKIFLPKKKRRATTKVIIQP